VTSRALPDDDLHHAWELVLDRLQLDAVLVERMVTSLTPQPPEPWDPPRHLGRIPEDLLPRARDLEKRQFAAMAALAQALSNNARSRRQAQRFGSAGTGDPTSVYVDTRA
jgi:hypothetical protein